MGFEHGLKGGQNIYTVGYILPPFQLHNASDMLFFVICNQPCGRDVIFVYAHHKACVHFRLGKNMYTSKQRKMSLKCFRAL